MADVASSNVGQGMADVASSNVGQRMADVASSNVGQGMAGVASSNVGQGMAGEASSYEGTGPADMATPYEGERAMQRLLGRFQQALSEQLEEQWENAERRWTEERTRWQTERTARKAFEKKMGARVDDLQGQIQVIMQQFARLSGAESRAGMEGGPGSAVQGGLSGVPSLAAAAVQGEVSGVPSLAAAAVQGEVGSVPSLAALGPSSAANHPSLVPLFSSGSVSEHRVPLGLGYAVKPKAYNGKESWEEYRVQFEAVSRANGWDGARKATALVASLEGSARGILTALSAAELTNYEFLVSALELRFGAKNLASLKYVLFQNCRQRRGESLTSLAREVERLAGAAFPECPAETRDKLAASQFITALESDEVRRSLRLSGFASLGAVVYRALEVEAVEALARDEARRTAPMRGYKPLARLEDYVSHEEESRREGSMLELWTAGPHAEELSGSQAKEGGKREEAGVRGTSLAYATARPPIVGVVSSRETKRTSLMDTVVEVHIEGTACLIVLDTGSSVNLIRKGVCSMGKLDRTRLRICSAVGEDMPVFGKGTLQIQLGDFLSEEEFFVVAMTEPCILDMAFLSKHRCQIDLARQVVCLTGGISVPLKGREEESRRPQEENRRHQEENRRLQEETEEKRGIPEHLRELFERCSMELTANQQSRFADLLEEFRDVFAKNPDEVGRCEIVQHRINTGDHAPIKQAPRRLPLNRRQEVDQLLEKMEAQGVIEKSQSPWSSPIVLVKKKDGSTRFCIDYRRLNEITKKDSYPLPRIEDTLDALANSTWFSTVDLQSGYWQIVMDKRDREKTAFCVGAGLWQFRVMPFGLCNAPATFERLMETVLQGLNWRICLVYLDDIIIHARTFDEEVEHLRQVFQRLRNAKLLMNPKKCDFLKRETKYLGHIVTGKGVKTDPEKIRAIAEWPVPANIKELRSFLGLCTYYRKFVRNFSDIAKPLHQLTENKQTFIWTEQHQKTFERLKSCLISSPVLAYPIEGADFILDTDASNVAIGAVLSQVQGGQEKVIAYFSKVLGKAERNYCVTRRELLAVVKSVEHFHHYLYGRRFLVRTDHAALRWLMSFKRPEGQIARWIERLQEYDIEIRHRGGKAHGNADALSRRPCADTHCKPCSRREEQDQRETTRTLRTACETGDVGDWRQTQAEDEDIGLILLKKREEIRPTREEISACPPQTKFYWTIWDSLEVKDGILYRKWESSCGAKITWLLVVPRKKVTEVLQECHSSPAAGHFGVNKTLAKVRQRFYWITCRQDVVEWCRKCTTCTAKKGPRERGAGVMQIYNVGAPFERIAMDVVGPLPKSSSGNRFLLVVADYFSKWPEVIPMVNQRAETAAKALLVHVVSRHGVPLEIHSDQGRNFESTVFKELMKLLGVKKTRTTPLHPQSDGMVERLNRTLLQYLSMFVAEHQRDWDEWIPMFLLAYRSARHETTQMTPSMVLYGQELRLPIQLWRGLPPQGNDAQTEFVSQLKERMKKMHEFVRHRLCLSSAKTKAWYDSHANTITFVPSEKVWLFQPRRRKGKCPKLQSDWEGPYVVVEKLNDVIYRIKGTARANNPFPQQRRNKYLREKRNKKKEVLKKRQEARGAGESRNRAETRAPVEHGEGGMPGDRWLLEGCRGRRGLGFPGRHSLSRQGGVRDEPTKSKDSRTTVQEQERMGTWKAEEYFRRRVQEEGPIEERRKPTTNLVQEEEAPSQKARGHNGYHRVPPGVRSADRPTAGGGLNRTRVCFPTPEKSRFPGKASLRGRSLDMWRTFGPIKRSPCHTGNSDSLVGNKERP
ncbi:uncharacterized protein LOC143187432 [Calliopsis andreniformis]|uniref:uncharacterized protein LOC143187432 n=1 Tax=Calliopsis andreniformis TaxID=337506 RepID=UPI003FCCA2D2